MFKDPAYNCDHFIFPRYDYCLLSPFVAVKAYAIMLNHTFSFALPHLSQAGTIYNYTEQSYSNSHLGEL